MKKTRKNQLSVKYEDCLTRMAMFSRFFLEALVFDIYQKHQNTIEHQ